MTVATNRPEPSLQTSSVILNGDAVQACPPSKIYRFRKFARRYRSALATASVLVLFLLTGIVGTTWQMLRAITAEREASSQTENAKLEAQRADAEARRAIAAAAISNAINDFVNNDLLAQADPTRSQKPDPNVRLRDVLDRAAVE